MVMDSFVDELREYCTICAVLLKRVLFCIAAIKAVTRLLNDILCNVRVHSAVVSLTEAPQKTPTRNPSAKGFQKVCENYLYCGYG